MFSFRRIWIATLMGVLSGIICTMMASSNAPLSMLVFLTIITGRILIGFVIGISNWKLPWALHGPLMGLLVGLPGAFGSAMGGNAEFSTKEMFFASLVMGIIYGFLIELVTTVLFKARQYPKQAV